MSEYTTKVHGLKRPIPYRLAEPELCNYEDAPDECVRMGDYVTVFGGYGPDGGELESTGELWGVTYGHDGFIDEVELMDEYGDGHRRAFPCEGVFYKAERPSGAIKFEAAYRAPAEVTGEWVSTRGWVCGNCNNDLHGYPRFCSNCGGRINYEKREDAPKAVLG